MNTRIPPLKVLSACVFGIFLVLAIYFLLLSGGQADIEEKPAPQAEQCLDRVTVDPVGFGDERTVQGGVDRVCEGGTVYVNKSEFEEHGHYNEAVVVDKDGISIIGNEELGPHGFTGVVIWNLGDEPAISIPADNVTIWGVQGSSEETAISIKGSNTSLTRVLASVDVDESSETSVGIHISETASDIKIRQSQSSVLKSIEDGGAKGIGVGVAVEGNNVRINDTYANALRAYRISGDASLTNTSQIHGEVLIQSGNVSLRENGFGLQAGVVVEPVAELDLALEQNHFNTYKSPVRIHQAGEAGSIKIIARNNVFQIHEGQRDEVPLVVNDRGHAVDFAKNYWRNGKSPEKSVDYKGKVVTIDHLTTKPDVPPAED